MRLLLLTAMAVAAISGGAVIYSTTPPNTENSFPAQYLSLSRRAPGHLSAFIASALPGCLPSGVRPLLSDGDVADLAVKIYFKSGVLMAEGKSEEQSSGELIPVIMKQAEPLSERQKERFLSLLNGGLTARETIFCVTSSIKESLAARIDVKASGWDLRS
jgi:hypothetical protein